MKKIDSKRMARKVLEELNRKLMLLRDEPKAIKRILIIDSILEEKEGVPLLEQGEEKQLKILLGLDKEKI